MFFTERQRGWFCYLFSKLFTGLKIAIKISLFARFASISIFVTFVKSKQKHFCQQSQQKCRQSATVCALAEGISAAADVFRLRLHTQAENIFSLAFMVNMR